MPESTEVRAVREARHRNRVAAIVADNIRTRVQEAAAVATDDDKKVVLTALEMAANCVLTALSGVTDPHRLGVDSRAAELIADLPIEPLANHVVVVLPSELAARVRDAAISGGDAAATLRAVLLHVEGVA